VSSREIAHRRRKSLTSRANHPVLIGMLLSALAVMMVAPCAPLVSSAMADPAITVSTDCESPDHPVSTCPRATEMHPNGVAVQRATSPAVMIEHPLRVASSSELQLADHLDRGHPIGGSVRLGPLRI